MTATGSQLIKLNDSFFPHSQDKYFHVFENGRDPVCDWIISNQKIYESYVLMMITPILRECSYLIDIGCHVGTYTFAKMLCENHSNTLSIDASQENIAMAKINSFNHCGFNSIHGFLVDASVSETHTFISNEYNGSHNLLHSSIRKNSSNTLAIPNIKTSAICNWINAESQKLGSEKKYGLIKIDIDGSEKNTSQELCASLTGAKEPFIMLIETNDPEVIEELNGLGMQILAFLPGNNFLICSREALVQKESLFCLHQSFGLITGYLNAMASNSDWLKKTGCQRDDRPVTIKTKYGFHKADSSIVSDYWSNHLSKYQVPMFCYG